MDKALIAILAAFVVLAVAAVVASESQLKDFRERCEAKGGEYRYISRHGPLCLAKGALLL